MTWKYPAALAAASALLLFSTSAAVETAQYAYPFQNPALAIEARVNNILSLMTLRRKNCRAQHRSRRPARLGIVGSGHLEGLHGVALGGPGGWEGHGLKPLPTTQFPQAVGLGETWDPDLLQKAAAIEGWEARYVFNTDAETTVNRRGEKHRRASIVMRAPNADLARDPRWGRSEESYGEDPYLTGTMATAFVKGLQGDNPKYWAHRLAHETFSRELQRRRPPTAPPPISTSASSANTIPSPFRMGVLDGGSESYMASYNAWNGVPMTANPILKEITMRDWGLNGIICTDAGALTNMVTKHKYFADIDLASAARHPRRHQSIPRSLR